MERVLVIGNAGAGKTTFAKQLAQKLHLPLVHLDTLYWYGNWEHLSRDEFDVTLQRELEKPHWIIDGNYNRTISHRLQYCDTVFYFDLPTVTCLAGVTKRILTNLGKARHDMGGNCIERINFQKIPFYRNVLTFNRHHRQDYYNLLNDTRGIQVMIFTSRRQARSFLKNL